MTRRRAAAASPASFALKRAEVRDLLAAMAEADPSLASLGPPGYLGRVSVWTKDAPLGAVRAAVLDAAGLSERTEDDRRILEKKTGASDAPVPVARSGGEPRLALSPADLTVRELELAGVASSGDAFVAFAYSPTGAAARLPRGRPPVRRRRALGGRERDRPRHRGRARCGSRYRRSTN